MADTRCATCSGGYDPKLDHQGRKGAPPRRYCSPDCARQGANDRRRRLRAHRRRFAPLAALHELEARGQLPFDTVGPLPPVPDFDDLEFARRESQTEAQVSA